MRLMNKFAMFIALACLTASCSNELKNDVDNLLRPVPTAMVLMPEEMVVQNGEMLLLPFRVNPSTYQVQFKDLQLDVVEHKITKSSYVTSIEEYTLESVEARRGADGIVREGEWIAKIKIKAGQYYSNSSLALVLQYTDANNKQALITSSTITNLNTRVKLSDKMITVLGSYSASTAYHEGNLFSSYIKIMPNLLSEGSSTLFDMKDVVVKSAMTTGDNAAMFTLQSSKEEPFNYTITPDLTSFRFDNDEQRFVTANIEMILKDANSDTEITKQVAVKYYRAFYTAPVTEISIADINSQFDAGTKPVVDIVAKDVLSNVGVTADLFKGLNPPTAFASVMAFLNVDESRATSVSSNKFFHPKDDATDPENMVLRMNFFSRPTKGDFLISAEIDYRSGAEPHSRIHATLKFPIRFID